MNITLHLEDADYRRLVLVADEEGLQVHHVLERQIRELTAGVSDSASAAALRHRRVVAGRVRQVAAVAGNHRRWVRLHERIVPLLERGRGAASIARELDVTSQTVRRHRKAWNAERAQEATD